MTPLMSQRRPLGPPPRVAGWAIRAQMRARRCHALGAGATVLLGDSLAAQWTPESELEALGLTPLGNLGIGGDRVEDVIWRLETYPLSEAPPRHIVLIAGSNNLPWDIPAVILERLDQLFSVIHRQAPDCRVFAFGILPRGPTLNYKGAEIAQVNAGLPPLARAHDVIALFANDELLAQGGAEGAALYYRDRSHLNVAGYAILARKLADALPGTPQQPAP